MSAALATPRAKAVVNKSLALPSQPECIYEVEQAVEELRRELEFTDDTFANVMVAVTEAVNNGLTHGNKLDAGKRVFVEFHAPNHFRLLVRVRDEGEGFDYRTLADPTAPENLDKIGGRGVFLMQCLSDELAFADEGRAVEMVFNI